ncbi:transcriptional regulator with XRE-family HTH domain [Kitasatospora sp. MAA4]|uniref:helix-turn-helix domain-containing protein n=1 Tax=Kitasatospora sp. MAA4 TaxID=3035093 RepID=UPI002475F2C7|nr:helix-turn-helix domain-containing protein [Kitasatospora sp. MAA4]MDH6135451.1 transcriptional regulator with XRE-family HTH domain [Kitasatospora sp. MAA4]
MQSDGDAAREPGTGRLVVRLRNRRGVGRAELAARVGISVPDLERLETGQWLPDRDTLMRLAEQLDLPLRTCNELLTSAGHPAPYAETAVQEPRMAGLRAMLDHVLRGYGDCPAMAVDRMWNLVAANEAAGLITDAVPQALRFPQINVLRTSVHPDCLARWTVNSAEWAGDLLGRVLRKAEETQDQDLAALYQELCAYHPGPHPPPATPPRRFSLLRINREGEELALVNVEMTFALPLDVTSDEISVQAFLPADAATADALRRRAAAAQRRSH